MSIILSDPEDTNFRARLSFTAEMFYLNIRKIPSKYSSLDILRELVGDLPVSTSA